MNGSPVKLWRAPFLLLIFVSACVTVDFERSYPDKHYFALDVGWDEKNAAPDRTVNGVLEVSELRISPRYQGQSFVYRISEAGYESDFYNQFLIAPAALITEELRKGLAQSRIFAYVTNSASQLRATHRLEGTVNALYGDFRGGGGGRAVVELEVFLTKQSPTGTEVVMDKRYSRSVPIARRSPEALVKGWDESLRAIFTSLVGDLKTANLQQASTSPTPP
ncbi:MAG TPA: hypothetical protein VFU31_31225, partial [Candidatus Binatia bacterium]|nr:hypothetical protein [Candidatus Binatia bacterium]